MGSAHSLIIAWFFN